MTLEELKKEAAEEIENEEFLTEDGNPYLWLIEKYIDKATQLERKRCAEIARSGIIRDQNKDGSIRFLEGVQFIIESFGKAGEAIATAIGEIGEERETRVTLEQDIQRTWARHGLRVTRETVKGRKWIIEAEPLRNGRGKYE